MTIAKIIDIQMYKGKNPNAMLENPIF